MKVSIHSRLVRNGMMMLCISVFLFGYANSNLFLHIHRVNGSVLVHSHFSGKDHRTDHSSGGHTAAQLQLLDMVNHAVYTDEAFEVFDLRPFCPPETVMAVPAGFAVAVAEWIHPSFRAPPVLD